MSSGASVLVPPLAKTANGTVVPLKVIPPVVPTVASELPAALYKLALGFDGLETLAG